jgi:Domain of unknown function (DUF1905)/Bacteriocin-protection, YdeI or OmpD-Associated
MDTLISFSTIIKKFGSQGEKTGWTYIEVPEKIAAQINPGVKKSYRVKGKLDDCAIKGISVIPMGGGDFIIALNAAIRKAIGKRTNSTVMVQLALDKSGYQLPNDLVECLKDEPSAYTFFYTLAGSHRNYFGKWIEAAKTDITRAKRIAMAVNALCKKMGYAEMLRERKQEKN